MRVLLVDNGTLYKKKMLKLLQEFEVVRVPYKDISLELLDQDFDFIVLTGAYMSNSVKYYGDKLWAREQELIKRVFGICLGAQLIAYSFDAKLSFVPGGKRIKGIKKNIYNVKQTPFKFFKYYGATVFSSQRWRMTELPDELEAWCASGEGIEVFRHKTKPLYGMQFHPERRAGKNDGARMFFTMVELETGFKSEILTEAEEKDAALAKTRLARLNNKAKTR
jgi:anthranilate/para-aminobenzoate synthase component II